MKNIDRHFVSKRFPILAALAIFAGAARAPGQQPSGPDLGEIAAAIGLPSQNLPANAKPSPAPAAVQKRLEVLKQLRRGGTPPANSKAGVMPSYHLDSIALAKTKVKNNDPDGAEEIIVVTSPFQPGTGSWSLDNATRLRMLSEELATDGDQKQAQALAARCLRHLDDAFARGHEESDKSIQITAKTSAGFVHERYTGDYSAAIMAYQMALQVDPGNEPARQALGRLQTSLAILRERVESNKR